MKKNKIVNSVLLLVLASTLILSCHKEDQVAGPDVYVVGWISPPKGKTFSIAAYWKNGTAVQLSDGTHSVQANSIFVSGTDVYVTGSIDYVPVYWKNGVQVAGYYSGLLFVQGSDVYLASTENVNSVNVAEYWKNGVPFILGDGIHESAVTSIFVSGSDVYVAGSVLSANGIVATYWKNGTAVTLGNGRVNSIFVSGNDVYVAGDKKVGSGAYFPVANYWKNGTPVSLTDGAFQSGLYSIFVLGTDVYAGGYEADGNNMLLPKYWKNGVPTVLPQVTSQGIMSNGAVASIAVFGSDVFAFVGDVGTWFLYKNGKAIPPFDGNSPDVHGLSMFVNTKGAGQ